MTEKININKVIDYWRQGAERSFDTASYLFKGKRYVDCLFFCHLTIEKILKSLVVKKTRTHAPYSHNLVELTRLAVIKLNKQMAEHFIEITGFNIAGRYNDYKLEFYRKCTKNYAEKYFKISKEIYLWLKKQNSLPGLEKRS